MQPRESEERELMNHEIKRKRISSKRFHFIRRHNLNALMEKINRTEEEFKNEG